MRDELQQRLRRAGVDPAGITDPPDAWRRLFAEFGRRVTLVDRYEIQAAALGCGVEDLDDVERAALANEVLSFEFPGFEFVGADPSGGPVAVADYDSSWPATFARWRDRLVAALGSAARRVDHVGSTAVPNLAAKPIIDIQVAVPDVGNEPAYVPPIESTGVYLRSRDDAHRYFRPPADRPRVVQIHVCEVGSTWERDHLLYRDYLRAHPAIAADYGALKRSLADRFRADRLAYTAAKTGFILDAMEDAARWSVQTGWTVS